MTSFSTAGGGAKAVTSILEGKKGVNVYTADLTSITAGTKEYTYIASATATAVNVTGSGFLAFSMFESNTSSTSGTVKITIDGAVVLNDTVSGDIGSLAMMQVGSFTFRVDGLAVSRDAVPFNKSLLVEVTCNVDATYNYDYYLN